MGTKTNHFGWNTIEGSADKLSDDDYKPLGADRHDLDERLYSALTHHHTGVEANTDAPETPLDLSLSDESGGLVASRTYWYLQTWVDGAGNESTPGPMTSITTPDPVVEPDTPILATQGTGGFLASGDYYYVLSAYAPDANRETRALNTGVVTAAAGSTNKNTITLPDLPDGAAGFNLYRLVPSGIAYFLLATIPMDVPTPPTNYVDGGTVPASTERSLPTVNTTNMDLSVRVCLGGTTPSIPPSFLWRIYRTATPDNWSNSRLRTVDGALCYTDKGVATTSPAPPTQSSFDAPEKIDLTDGNEVQGNLPPSHVAYPEVVQFAFPGTLEEINGTFVWRCQFDEYWIRYVTVNLGSGSTASGQDDIFDVLWWDASAPTPSWVSLFEAATPVYPRVVVGEQFADEFIPTHRVLMKGDLLKAAILQVGDVPTPTDFDALIQVYGWAKDDTLTSVVFP
jgi:hypothetical protein